MAISLLHSLDEFSTSTGILIQTDTGGLIVAKGTTAQRPSAATSKNGLIRYNSDNDTIEAIIAGVYQTISTSGGGSVTSVATGTGLTGGPITSTGTISLASISTGTVLANISGSSAAPTATTVTALLDSATSSTQGSIIYRNSSTWVALAPGTSGQVLTTGGSSANPSWTTVSGGSGSGVINLQNQAFVSGTDFTPGTTTTLTLSSSPSNGSSLEIFADGVYQNHSVWTLSGSTVTFTSAIPLGTQRIEAVWTVSSTSTTPAVTFQDFVDGTDYTSGTSTTLTLTGTPPLSGTLLNIYADGVYQNHNTWSYSNSVVTFSSVIPAGVSKIEAIWSNAAAGYSSSVAIQDLVSGTDFIAGTSTTITLNSSPPSAAALEISFDGVQQFHNTWSLSGSIVTFTSAIPYNVANIEARWITGAGLGTALTQPQHDNSTNIATTQFVAQNNTGGFLNKIRNPVMNIAQRGATGSIIAGTPSYCLDGWILSSTGANITWQQGVNFVGLPTGVIAPNYLFIVGNTGNTDVTLTQRIESVIATSLAGRIVTLQFIIGQSNGSALIPTLRTKYPTAVDNWASSTTDLATVNLQSCASGSNVLVSYTFTVSANAVNGYEIIIDLGALNSNAKSLNISSFDLRDTPNTTLGLNSSPPIAEVRLPSMELALCQRYLYTLGGSGGGQPAIGGATSSTAFGLLFNFPVNMRNAPTQTVNTASYFSLSNMSGSTTAISTLTASTTSVGSGFFLGTVASGLTANASYYLQTNNTAITGNIIFSAEL